MKPFTYFDFNTTKENRIHLVKGRHPYAFCGQKVPEGATEVDSSPQIRLRLCLGCKSNFAKQGQGFSGPEDLP